MPKRRTRTSPKWGIAGGSSDTILSLVGDLYEAALDPAAWGQFLARIGAAAGGTTPVLVFQNLDDPSGSIVAGEIDPERARAYDAYYARINPFLARPPPIFRAGAVLPNQAAISDRELERTEFNAEFQRPSDEFHTLGACAFRDERRLAMLSVQRSRRGGPFEAEELAVVEQIMPHLQRALRIHARLAMLQHERHVSNAMLDSVPHGMLLLASDGRLVYANRVAREICQERDGLTLSAEGRPIAASSALTMELRRMVADALSMRDCETLAPQATMRLPRRSGRRPLAVLIAQVPPDSRFIETPSAAVAVFVSDPERKQEPATSLLRRLYGLTAAEARLAILISEGVSPHEAADRLGIGVSTVRTQLKQLFAKTETRRQAELVSLILRGPAALALSDIPPHNRA